MAAACLNLSTNVNLEGVDTSSIQSEASSIIAKLAKIPESFVMVVLNGSIPISLGGTDEPAAYGELLVVLGLNLPGVHKELSAAISNILETKLSVPNSRFYLKFSAPKGGDFGCHGTTLGFF